MPIIALSAVSALEDRDACVQAGMDDCLDKAASPQTLGATLGRWVSVSSHLSPSEQSRIASLHAQRVVGEA